ncbi:MAG: LamG domain-containing protein, partial [bacterium]
VNGIVSSIAVANQWQYITVTTGTALNASDLDIGRIEGVGNHEGKIDDIRIYSYVRTRRQILADMAGGQAQKQYVGYWDFNEGQGAVAFDKSANNNDGTITGADWTLNGKFGGALDFESGSSDYVNASTGSSLNITGNITLEAWIKPESTVVADIIAKWGTNDSYFLRRTSDKIQMGLDSDGVEGSIGSATSNNTAPNGSWTHVVGTWDGSTIRVYLNGVEDGSTVYTAGIHSNSSPTWIGQNPHPWGPFDGLIDEVKIYPFVLTPAEIKQEYNQGKTMVLGSPRNSSSVWDDGGFGGAAPVAIWKMDEKADGTCSGGVNDVCDTSQNSNDGAITGATWKSAGECKQGSCLGFDGSGDYVNCGSNASLSPTKITIEAWFVDYGGRTGIYPPIMKSSSFTLEFNGSNLNNWFKIAGTWCQTGSAAVSTNVWHHVVATFDGTIASYYFDGNLVASTSAYSGDLSSAGTVWIGRSPVETGRIFQGLIDDVRIYNYARTPAQIAWDYNRAKPKLHWKFDENTGATAYDYYKTKNGDLTGHSPDWTGAADQCKFNYCLDFTPANLDYVDVGNTGIGTNLQAVSFWIYPDSVVSQNIIDLDNGTHKITTDGSGNLTANGWTSPTYYKNGVQTAAPVLTASTWQNIMITTATAFSPSDVDFGRVAANYFDGRLDEIKFYTYPLTAGQVKMDYQGGAVRMGPGEGLP